MTGLTRALGLACVGIVLAVSAQQERNSLGAYDGNRRTNYIE